MRMALACGQKAVLLCDRGTMDGSAYIKPSTWSSLLDRHSLDLVQLRDSRYNAVFHLVTAADGAEEYYSSETNATRLETAEEARTLDTKLQRAWVGHPKLIIIDNSTNFETKLQRLVDSMSRLLGLPTASKSFRKFTLKAVPAHIPVKCEVFRVEKVYIRLTDSDPDEGEASYPYAFVRSRRQGGVTSYGMTVVSLGPDGQVIEQKHIISKRVYESATSTQADPSRRRVVQKRTTFLWRSQYFEIYEYVEPRSGLCVLNAQVPHGTSGSMDLPPFLEVDEEVTENAKYSAYNISLL
jgi:hypothetical protein